METEGGHVLRTGARHRVLIGVALLVAALSAGCLRAQAKTPEPTPLPILQTPEPPSRLLIPVPIETPAPTPTPTPTPTPAVRPPTGGRGAPPGAPPTTTPPPPDPAPPPPVLQTTASLAELEARARERLDRAEKDLGRVSVRSLGADARDQYDSAKRFIRMAKDAITAKNFFYAAYCADKAATLASLLVK